MDLQPIKRFELVELNISANIAGRFYFETQPQLRNQADQIIKIQKIQVYSIETYGRSQSNNALLGMAIAEIPKAVLVLYVDGEESIFQIPLAQLINQQAAANSPFQQEIQTFADLNNVAWEKSYVQFNAAAAGSTYVIPFGISYLKYVRNPSDSSKWIDATTLTPM